ncbi:hypothetical protein GTP23_00460 [Pseudoduganella sp. FT93W]|uniref:DDE-type integrase/transposase/recombinase n=1 Tax=Duganella fentianensis TaxID=2692177 RepID=A0A845HX94_9BURK|nr:hypothetical protein [Duganella fentianensis]MYN43536.1 hypothetical protein [Duganella fentianensis]
MTKSRQTIEVITISELAAARAQIAQLGKNPMEAEILKEAMEFAREKKWIARAPFMDLMTRSSDWVNSRTVRQIEVLADLALVEAARAEIGQLLTYGGRRASAWVNCRRMAAGLALFNHSRFYRVMKAYRLLLPKAPKRVVSARVHDGVMAVLESNRRWCSDGFEIGCDNGDVVTGAFLKDCRDREIISWRAWPSRGLPGEPVHDRLVKDWGIKPVHTPVYSPQSNGMAGSFVKTFKRDYVSRMDCSSADIVLRQMPAALNKR